jgi:hypothetical protein
MVVHTFTLRTQEAEHEDLKLKTSLDYTAIPCLQKKKEHPQFSATMYLAYNNHAVCMTNSRPPGQKSERSSPPPDRLLPPPKKTTTRQAWKADTTLTSPA